MGSEFSRTSHTAHLIFFEMVENSGANRRDLSSLALSLANQNNTQPIALAQLLQTLRWAEYQTMLSILSLKAHTAIRWDEDELASLRQWAEEPIKA